MYRYIFFIVRASLIIVLLAGCKKSFSPENMKHVPVPEGGITFPMGADDLQTGTISYQYEIGETEMTWEVWNNIYAWATDVSIDHDGDGEKGDDVYSFANRGQRESDSGGVGMTGLEPVTMVSWRDSIVFCNALTEYYNREKGKDYECVFYTDADYTTPLRTSTNNYEVRHMDKGSEDAPYIKAALPGNIHPPLCTADGFRIPTDAEWEMAARWCGDNINGRVGLIGRDVNGGGEELTPGYFWIPGNCSSGNWRKTDRGWQPAAEYDTELEKSSSISGPNDLEICDMNEHIWEVCFDWYEGGEGAYRILRDSTSEFYYCKYQPVGMKDRFAPYSVNFNLGFRLARTL